MLCTQVLHMSLGHICVHCVHKYTIGTPRIIIQGYYRSLNLRHSRKLQGVFLYRHVHRMRECEKRNNIKGLDRSSNYQVVRGRGVPPPKWLV